MIHFLLLTGGGVAEAISEGAGACGSLVVEGLAIEFEPWIVES